MKNIYILGAAGSIGLQTLNVIKRNRNSFNLIGISLGSCDKSNKEILKAFQVEIACLRETSNLSEYVNSYPKIKFVIGDSGLTDIARYPKKGLLVNALSGSAGLRPTVVAIKNEKDIALANKETLVMAGSIISDLIEKHNVKLYPIDSEHSALWQLMKDEENPDIAKIVITASGGAFRDLSREQLLNVKKEDALKHPNWEMGSKITIDSATMMNKGLEVIEAHHLFKIPFDQIETILHKQSVVHALVYFKDGTIKASMSQSNMEIPISYALFYPKRATYQHNHLKLENLSFAKLELSRFPLLKLACEVGSKSGLLPTVMNAANEAAVKLFLADEISFLDIEEIVIDTVTNFSNMKDPTIDEIIETDNVIQKNISHRYRKR